MIVVKANAVYAPPFRNVRIELAVRALVAVGNAARVNVTLTDWYRDATANLAAGGASASQHLLGTAFDLRADAGGARAAQIWRLIGGRVLDETSTAKPHWHLDLG